MARDSWSRKRLSLRGWLTISPSWFKSPCFLRGLRTLLQRFRVPDNYRKAYGGSEGDLAAQNLEKFLMMSSAFRGRLSDFLLKIAESISLDEDGNASSESQNAVRLMTIHKSEGLEFPVVFVIGLGKSWESDKDRLVKDQNGKICYLPLKKKLLKTVSHRDILPYHADELDIHQNRPRPAGVCTFVPCTSEQVEICPGYTAKLQDRAKVWKPANAKSGVVRADRFARTLMPAEPGKFS